ncbi:GNAT family N-acetyltransferase [Paraoerskovia marina]|uniref:GNAT family N-acetyltransferase n=1 Tax=Paraoerskovia marina TaxID=545619 RepID=UPI000492C352|nr:N-acetyltransferase [Paraoerskovia marina]
MDTDLALAAYDAQIRRAPRPDDPAASVESDGAVVRVVCDGPGWNTVTWSGLAGMSGAQVDEVIAAQVARFGQNGRAWEWKHHDGDVPVDLAVRLVAAGLTREPDEAVMVAEIADLDLADCAPDGVELQDVRTPAEVDDLVAVHDLAFGGDHTAIGQVVGRALDQEPPTVVGVVARADGRPVAAGRVELHHGTEFASLWGGGTVPQWRSRGVFRALVAHRARIAAGAGFCCLQVDAAPTSRPILERLGFQTLTVTRPFTLDPTTPGAST